MALRSQLPSHRPSQTRLFSSQEFHLGELAALLLEHFAAQSPRLLIFTGRDSEKVSAVIDELRANYPAVSYRALHMDLSSQKCVRQAAAEVIAYPENIDILINNAGVMALPERTL